jgi:hypothetical protein
MTSLVQNRIGLVSALLLGSAVFLWWAFASSPPMLPSTMGVFGALWLATMVIALTALRNGRAVESVGQLIHDVDSASPPTARLPAYAVNVSRPVQRWNWKSVLLAPLELVALAESVPLAILLIMVPIGLALAGALWVVRLILDRF